MANQAAVGGNIVYPNLSEIADLFRAQINDTFNNSGGSGTGSGGGAGLVMNNSNPDLMTLMRSGIRTLFSDLRNVGDPELIIDNYILTGLPALATTDPAVQVAIGYNGFFDGYQWHADWTLPVGLKKVGAIWERQSGVNEDFVPMQRATMGLPSVLQGTRMGWWEPRQGAIWMVGSTESVDIRIRGTIGFPSTYNVANLDFDTTYVPIQNCADAVMAKMLKRYAARLSPELYQMAVDMEKTEMDKLFLEVVREKQDTENARGDFGNEAVQDFAIAWSWL